MAKPDADDDSKTYSLEDVPQRDSEFEDLISALFQAGGYFVEANVDHPEQVLEIDVAATSYWDAIPENIIAEAKRKRLEQSEVFKVLGWMRFLNVPRGGFFYYEETNPEVEKAARDRFGEYGISIARIGGHGDSQAAFEKAGFRPIVGSKTLRIARYGGRLRRAFVKVLREQAKSNKALLGPRAAYDYLRLVNDGIFFVADLRKRLSALYDAFKKHPRLSNAVAVEKDGGGWDPQGERKDTASYREAFSGRHDLIQSVWYAEHRGRLAVLKAAVDYVVLKDAGMIGDGGKVGGFDWGKILFDTLPSTFRDGLEILRGRAHFAKYPTLWQSFIWLLGGFYLSDRKEQEFRYLSRVSGVPAESVEEGLDAYNQMFPTSGSWFANWNGTQAVMLKMIPHAVYGLGAHHRLLRYNKETFDGLGYSDYTGENMRRWNNAAVDFLLKNDPAT